MKKLMHLRRMLAALSVVIATTRLATAATYDWTGASGLFWLTPANWNPVGPPGPADDPRFFDPGAVLDTTTINNTVSANTTVRSLWIGQTNGIHNMLINPGVTLTVRGTNDNGSGPLGSDPNATDPNPNVQSTFYVGTKSEVEVGTVVTATISGGGILVLNNTNNELNVRQVFGGGGGAHVAVLDMSGLDTFVANLGRIRIGDGEAGRLRRAQGTIRLARTNTITLSGTNLAENVQLIIGNNDVNNNGNGGTSFLYLGERNTLFIDEILVGARKTPGTITFNDNLTAPSLVLRGSDGAGRIRALRIGDESDQNNSGNPTTGTINLSGGTVDILADKVIIGKHQTGGNAGATGNLLLGAGTLDVNTLQLADQTDNQATTATSGTATFIGTTVQVNNTLSLGRSAGATGPMSATLNVIGGKVNVAGSYTNQGTVNIGLTNAQFTLAPNSKIVANNVTLDGSAISNVTALTVTNQLIVLNGGAIAGNPTFSLGNSGAASWDFTAVPGGLAVSNSLAGAGNVLGDLTVRPGATLSPAVGSQSLTVQGNVTLNNVNLAFDLSTNATDLANDLLTATANLTLVGTNNVFFNNLGGSFDTVNKYTLISYAGTLTGNASNFRAAGPLADSRYTFAFDTSTPSKVQLTVGGSGPKNLTWVGDGTANNWDAKASANWNNGTGADQFFSLDSVTFNDSGSAAPSVNLVGTVKPGSFTVNNPTKSYTFSGTGGVSAGGALIKTGAGALTFGNTGDNSFSSVVTITNGNVTFSNTGLNTFGNGLTVAGGSVTFSGNNANTIVAGSLLVGTGTTLSIANANANDFGPGGITVDGSVIFNQSADATVNSSITGAGSLTKNGSNTLTLSGDNSSFMSVMRVNAGTLRAGSATVLGPSGVIITNGAKLDIYGRALGTAPITASGSGPSGEGAIVSTAGAQGAGVASVTLAGDTTFGGAGAWNTDPVLNVGLWTISASLSTGNQPYNLTKVGPNQVTLNGATIDPALGDIEVQQGLLAFQGATDTMGNSTKTLTVRAGATVSFFSTTTAWNKKFVLFGNGVTPSLLNYNGENAIAGPITLNGNCVIGAVPSDRGMPVSLTLSGPVGGSGGLTKPSVDTLILSAVNTYTGDTVVNAGTLTLTGSGSIASSSEISVSESATLDASARTDGTLTLASGQALKGNGSVTGNLVANAGSIVSPGTSVGTLTISGAITLHGTTQMELNKANGTNDVLRSSTGAITYGGTLSLTNLAGSLTDGVRFKLFDAASYAGSFSNILPATPGPGQTWDTSELNTTGTLKVVGNPVVSALIAYEGFDYPAGQSLPGLSGGTGFANAWQTNNTPVGSALIRSMGLAYTDSLGNALVTSGNSAFFTGTNGTAQPNRDLLSLRGADGTTTWYSFIGVRQGPTTNNTGTPNNIYPRGANLAYFSNTVEKITVGNPSGAASNVWTLTPNNVAASAQPSQTPFSQQAFIVVRVDHKAGNDDAYLFVNPTLNSEPSVSSAAARSTNGFDFSFNRIRPFAGNYDTANSRPFAELLLDEIRIGETFASVTPFTPGTGGPPTLSISRSGNQVEISWSAGILESASSLSGTWSTVQGAAPPSYKTTPDGTQKYFRVRQ